MDYLITEYVLVTYIMAKLLKKNGFEIAFNYNLALRGRDGARSCSAVKIL